MKTTFENTAEKASKTTQSPVLNNLQKSVSIIFSRNFIKTRFYLSPKAKVKKYINNDFGCMDLLLDLPRNCRCIITAMTLHYAEIIDLLIRFNIKYTIKKASNEFSDWD